MFFKRNYLIKLFIKNIFFLNVYIFYINIPFSKININILSGNTLTLQGTSLLLHSLSNVVGHLSTTFNVLIQVVGKCFCANIHRNLISSWNAVKRMENRISLGHCHPNNRV